VRVASKGIDTITAAPLVNVAGAVKVAVELSHLGGRRCRATPAFTVVLRAAVGKALGCTGRETLVCRVVGGAIQLLFQLATGWIALPEAANVAVLTLTVLLQWTTLLCRGSAGEGHLDLAEVDVVGVDNP
jgi:hypothetical protein